MTPDPELLATFARTNSEDAFAELVKRHVNLVYSAALRQVGDDAHLAQDVAQTVFSDLARKAGFLAQRETLTGWLYTSAHFAAAKIIRTETRRHDREEKFMREPTHDTAPEPAWENLRPVLDDAMHELKEVDREAILLRYFENRQFAEVGARLGLNENAARMRVDRVLEKLRAILARRGLATTAAFAATLAAHAVQVAPAGLASTLTTASLAAGGTGTFTLLKIMTLTQVKLTIGALVVAGTATAFVLQHQAQEKLLTENTVLAQQLAQSKFDNESLSNRLTTADDSRSLAGDSMNELLKLRGEVGMLRHQAADMAKLREENKRLQNVVVMNARPVPAKADAQEQEQEHQAAIQKLNTAKQGLLAFIMFADDNSNQFPTNFASASRYVNGDFMAQVETNFDLVYQGSMTNIADPSATIVLKEKSAWQSLDGRWSKTYGFADGHATIQSEPDGNFDDYENQHIIAPPPAQ